MINPEKVPIDVDEVRAWAQAHKQSTGMSWTEFGRASGIPAGTLSPFVTGIYQGDNDRIAREMFRYRQTLNAQKERAVGMLVDPGYFDTPTSSAILGLLKIAHLGRITVAAMGPGIGKTMSAREYALSAAHCWIATMSPSTRGVASMAIEVLESMGQPGVRGTPQMLSRTVRSFVAGKRGLLIVDEAQNLNELALDELRSWHDATRLGICLLGNEELLMRLEARRGKDSFGRLNSRIAMRILQDKPREEDALAFCDAWTITEPAQRQFVIETARSHRFGGLRDCAMMLEQASMIAADEDRPLTLADLRDAQAQRSTRRIAA